MNTTSVKAWNRRKDKDLQLMQIERREVTPTDIEIDILYCGVCHSATFIRQRNDWGGTKYPSVPGHEIIVRITKVGSAVTKFKVGDLAGANVGRFLPRM